MKGEVGDKRCLRRGAVLSGVCLHADMVGSTAVVVMAMNASDWKLTLITTNRLVAGCCRSLRVGSKEFHSSYESFSG